MPNPILILLFYYIKDTSTGATTDLIHEREL